MLKFFTPETHRLHLAKQSALSNENTVAINTKKICYISAGILHRQDILVEAANITYSELTTQVFIEFLQHDDDNACYKLTPKIYDGKIRAYLVSLAGVLTNLGISKVNKLTRVPFHWRNDFMVIDVRSLKGAQQ